jgi:hypothetical protein
MFIEVKKMRNFLLVVAVFAFCSLAIGCDLEEEGAEECCKCLVKYNCIDSDEYDYCKDQLAGGDSIELSGWDLLTCNDEACIEAGKCQ